MGSLLSPYRIQRLRWACLVTWALGALVLATPLNELLSRPLVDQQLRALAVSAPVTGVTVVDIDEASMRALKNDLGPWPYRRDVHALAIDELRRAGVRAIAFDIVLADEREGDAALAKELVRPGAPVLLPGVALGQALEPRQLSTAADIGWAQMMLPSASILQPQMMAAHVGVITMPLDSDGRLRRWPLWHEANGQRWPSLPLAVWQATHRADAKSWPPPGPSGLTIPIGDAAASIARLPFSMVMDAAWQRIPREALAERVRDQVVFIGAGAMMADSVLAPGGPVNGTDALAHAYASLRERHVARLPSPGLDATLAVLSGLPLLLAALRRTGSLRQGLGWLALAAAGLLALVLALLWGGKQLIQPAAALVVLMASSLCLAAWRQHDLKRAQAQLEEERRRADDASRAKSEFLARVSHEIRTPMNALMGAAELLQRSPLAPADRQLVGLFTDAGHNLQTLLNDMLDLSRVEAGRLELHVVPFSLAHTLQRVQSLVAPRAERKGLKLTLKQADDLPQTVLGDNQRLEQVLLNLLSNAVNFTEDGEVSLEVSREGEQIRFVVADTGIGVAPNKLQLIFEPFTQADGSMSRHYGGSGLGLSIVRQLAQLMGGTIQARSEPGRGSAFTLHVPLPETSQPVAISAFTNHAGPSAQDPAPLSGLRVLLVEDNEVNVVIFQAMLQNLGLHLDIAANGVEGLDRLRTQTYDLAFVDIQMPVMDGLTMAKLFREDEARDPQRRRLPLIALTANAYAADASLSLEAGCDLHVPKPYSRQQLLDALNQFAPSRAAGTELPTVRSIHRDTTDPASARATVLDTAGAMARLGDPELYDGLKRHARVFLGAWETDYLLAQKQAQRDRQRALAHDLKTVLSNIGARDMMAPAATLNLLLASPAQGTAAASGPSAAEAAALDAIRMHLPGVLQALETPRETAPGPVDSWSLADSEWLATESLADSRRLHFAAAAVQRHWADRPGVKVEGHLSRVTLTLNGLTQGPPETEVATPGRLRTGSELTIDGQRCALLVLPFKANGACILTLHHGDGSLQVWHARQVVAQMEPGARFHESLAC